MLDLPPDILLLIFSYLDLSEAYSLACVSNSFASTLAHSPQLWKSWWTQNAWLRKLNELPEEVTEKEKGDERDWRMCCARRYIYELNQLDKTSDLCWVAYQGNAKAIRKLIALGVNINYVKGKTTPLHCAAERGHTRAINALVELGADVNATRDVTPLHLAARYGRNDAITHLVALGAHVDAKSANHSSPLHFAVHAGAETLRTLVKLGADVDARNAHNDTPLHEAAENSCASAAQALIELGADVNARNAAGSTPLHNAAECPHGITHILLRMGAQVDAKDNVGVTPYHLAVWRNNAEAARELAERGAKADKPPDGALFVRLMKPGIYSLT